MNRRRICVLGMAAALLLPGCGSVGSVYSFRGVGLLYTHTVHPLSRHRDPATVVRTSAAGGGMKEIEFRYFSIQWDDKSIGEIARKGGIETIHYADLETKSYLLGIWKRRTVRVYGTAAEQAAPSPPAGVACGK